MEPKTMARLLTILLTLSLAAAFAQASAPISTHGETEAQAQLPAPAADPHHNHDHAHDHDHDHAHDETLPPLPEPGDVDPSLTALDRPDFEKALDLQPLRLMSVQNNSTLQTLDTFARQQLTFVTGKSTIGDQDPVYTLFDMAYRPWVWADQRIIKVKNVPLRKDLADHLKRAGGWDGERLDTFVHDGKLSAREYVSPAVQAFVREQQSAAMHKAEAVQQMAIAAMTLQSLLGQPGDVTPPARIIPPVSGTANKWHATEELLPNVPFLAERFPDAQPLPGYSAESATDIVVKAIGLRQVWIDADATTVNTYASELAPLLEAVNPSIYPSETKRKAEVVYNRLARLTLPGAMVYFVAFVLLLMASRSGTPRLRIWGLRAMLAALLIHTAGIGIRWWLVEKSTGDWFHSIPIKNQFESVMFAAWFAAVVGLLLELRRKPASAVGGLYAAAGSFFGWLAMLALFAAPYVFGRDIGGQISQAQGILMSYWLYIHVTLVVASYGLIGMGFLLSVWWLIGYYRHRDSAASPRAFSADKLAREPVAVPGLTPGFWRTLGRVLFLPTASYDPSRPHAFAPARAQAAAIDTELMLDSPTLRLARLDQCNLVVLQLAFWVLAIGIICGAIWADVSWGRPWGWDPKETFALITWIVYLIVVHVRLTTPHKAWWTAVLSIVGFAVMLFNWIGVNFFFVGLHSYA